MIWSLRDCLPILPTNILLPYSCRDMLAGFSDNFSALPVVQQRDMVSSLHKAAQHHHALAKHAGDSASHGAVALPPSTALRGMLLGEEGGGEDGASSLQLQQSEESADEGPAAGPSEQELEAIVTLRAICPAVQSQDFLLDVLRRYGGSTEVHIFNIFLFCFHIFLFWGGGRG